MARLMAGIMGMKMKAGTEPSPMKTDICEGVPFTLYIM